MSSGEKGSFKTTDSGKPQRIGKIMKGKIMKGKIMSVV